MGVDLFNLMIKFPKLINGGLARVKRTGKINNGKDDRPTAMSMTILLSQ